MERNLTEGNLLRNLLRFALPYLLSCFLQTFYGLADLFIVGQYKGAAVISAVSIGSQVTHMVIVVLVGLSMGTTINIGRAVGMKNSEEVARVIAATILLFSFISLFITIGLLLGTEEILQLLSTPPDAFASARSYLLICFAGIPFIIAYNVISSIFRGLGDSRRPMYFIAIAGIINILLDYLFIGTLSMGASGAALATIIAQAVSVLLALVHLLRSPAALHLSRQDFRSNSSLTRILAVGSPVAAQDGLIQIAFLVITMIANRRGLTTAAAVGIVEKCISFFFLLPSAMLSSVSAMGAQLAGAKKDRQAKQVLAYALSFSLAYGLLLAFLCHFEAPSILKLFSREDPAVIHQGAQYLKAYGMDCIFGGIQFCFTGYFCAYGKSWLSFLHNILSLSLIRIPGAYLASLCFPDSLYPMGLAAPLGSVLSSLICIFAYWLLFSGHSPLKNRPSLSA